MATRPRPTIETAITTRKPVYNDPNGIQRELSDRVELAVAARQQQRLKFSRQNPAFASTGEVNYY